MIGKLLLFTLRCNSHIGGLVAYELSVGTEICDLAWLLTASFCVLYFRRNWVIWGQIT